MEVMQKCRASVLVLYSAYKLVGAQLSYSENRKILSARISSGNLDKYFNRFSREDSRDLCKEIATDNSDETANILINNLTAHGSNLAPAIDGGYDAEVKALGKRFIEEYVKELDQDMLNAIKNDDLSSIEALRKEITDNSVNIVSFKAKKILNELETAIKRLRIPSEVKKQTKEIIQKKKLKLENITAKVFWKFGRNKSPALVLFNKTGFASWKPITRKEYSQFKKEIDSEKREVFSQIKEEAKERPKLETRRNLPFSIKEQLFIKSRINQDEQSIFLNYTDKFGRVRSKKELINEIRRQRK